MEKETKVPFSIRIEKSDLELIKELSKTFFRSEAQTVAYAIKLLAEKEGIKPPKSKK